MFPEQQIVTFPSLSPALVVYLILKAAELIKDEIFAKFYLLKASLRKKPLFAKVDKSVEKVTPAFETLDQNGTRPRRPFFSL
jgi:ABC-type polysaccharide transport system permease subunit